MTDAEMLLEARRRAARRMCYPGNQAKILQGLWDNKKSVVRALREVRVGLMLRPLTADQFGDYPPVYLGEPMEIHRDSD